MLGSDQFETDENGLTSDGYRCLEPSSKKAMYIVSLIIIVVAAAAAFAVVFFAKGDEYRWERIAAVAAFALVAAFRIVYPVIYYRRYRYRIAEDAVDIRRGVFVITHELVPIERIHQVEVSSGPILRMFNLADVAITTAGGTAYIQYLEKDEAEGIAAKLKDVVVNILQERD